MPTEVANYIGELDQSRPQGSESVSEADDHQRLVKKCLTQTMLGDTANSDLWDTALLVGPRYLNDLPNTYTPENWVTLDTEQTITAAKTFEAAIQADLGINNANGDNLISEAADVTAISNYADDTVVLGTDADTLSVAWNAGANTAIVLNESNFLTLMQDTLHPVGSVIMSADPAYDPNTAFSGQTWVQNATGRVIGAVGSHEDANTETMNFPQGDIVEGTYNHTLTEAEMPAHTHGVPGNHQINRGSGGSGARQGDSFVGDITDSTGSGDAHNNIQPTYAYYVWERTA